jgi:hypothetical protein
MENVKYVYKRIKKDQDTISSDLEEKHYASQSLS